MRILRDVARLALSIGLFITTAFAQSNAAQSLPLKNATGTVLEGDSDTKASNMLDPQVVAHCAWPVGHKTKK